eukprot:CAMPEP_0177763400 /NCGR_PEP_ID=MMETSP0491_2-20121128/6851_1 /TAXON_ID=63592 /ORGANISM="Tetraselmis chuii, Strain PLY429" /LENGTH=464 /DNA_ID=CAMNT_0019279505 /DNA_START=80 /DNA_END=1474 /DNA_ORIENTATION=+
MVKVNVKWQKETFKDVEVDEGQPPLVFKTQLFTLSGVPPERQKIMVKGGLLKDDGDWAKLGLKEGQKLMMMGTADAVPEAPKEATVFLEDLPEEEQYNQETKAYGAGLQNLGNTCYMNSTVQCLFSVPPLKSALQEYAASPASSTQSDSSHRLVLAANDLWKDLDASASSVPPMRFLMALREKFPQFSQQGEGGMFMQQDAEECWTQFLYVLRERLRENGVSTADSAIQKMFGLGLHTSLKCEEGDETIEEDSTALTLKCNITIDVNHLEQGIDLALIDDREKHSATLGRTALFKGKSSLTSLPPFLTVQMVRFYYKVDVQQKAKILRKVTFPTSLDLFDRCTDELKKELESPREAFKQAEDAKVGVKKAAAEAEAGGDVEMVEAAPSNQGRPTGKYSLQAVLTHKGRSADSGHYVSWVKQADGKWVEFDDDNLILREADDILKLCGGGDWHMAYMLLYKAETI